MVYPTLKKYFCSCTNNKETHLERLKRTHENYICGWIARNNKWIKVETFHPHPNYLHQLNNKKVPAPCSFIDEEILGTFKSKGNIYTKTEHYYNKLLQISYDCIQEGCIRVTSKNNVIYLNANCLERLYKGYKILNELYDITCLVVGEIVNKEGVCTQTLEYDFESKTFKKIYI